MKLVYLSGPIAGLTYAEATDWRDEISFALDPGIKTLSPMRGKSMLVDKGRITTDLLASMRAESSDVLNIDSQAITTRDRFDVQRCDAMILYMLDASPKAPSVGSSIELGWADAWRVPVIMVCKRDDDMQWYWRHPLVRSIVGWHVEDLQTAARVVNTLFKTGN